MPERLKELHLTVSWTKSQPQIQIKTETHTEALAKTHDAKPCFTKLGCKKRLTLHKELAKLAILPICKTRSFEQQQLTRRVQLYSGCPFNIKLYMPESMPNIRNQTPKASNNHQPAMHRKSKSKSKIIDFSISSSAQPISLEETIDTCAVTAVGGNAPKHFPAKENSLKRLYSRKNRKTSHSRLFSASPSSVVRCKMLVPLPSLGATSIVTLLTLICMETILLSTMSSCAKTFYMHWNTSNSIFRIDNTDHIIDVNKGNLAFEFDQVHIICPVYEPGTFENETEKYIIYNVSKVEYETCRITNADPRVIAICDKPQKLMFFTITFRPFTPQPGGLEFLPGNDYYFISTSSKDDLYRRIGGRCSTNNMKVVFKVCCATEEKNKTSPVSGADTDSGGGSSDSHGHMLGHGNNIAVGTSIGISGVKSVLMQGGPPTPNNPSNGNSDINTNGISTSINSNLDQFNRIPIQPNIMGNNIGTNVIGQGIVSGGGIILSPGHGHGSINMLQPGRGGINIAYPGHHHIQTGIRINNVPTQHSFPPHKSNVNSNTNNNDDIHHYEKHPNEVVKNEELTYNSGSTQTDKCIYNFWGWLCSWVPLPPLLSCCLSWHWINSSLVLSIAAILGMHYVAGKALITQQWHRLDIMVFAPSCTNDSRGHLTTTFRYDR